MWPLSLRVQIFETVDNSQLFFSSVEKWSMGSSWTTAITFAKYLLEVACIFKSKERLRIYIMAQEDHPWVVWNYPLLAEYSYYINIVNAHSNPAEENASRCKATFLPSLFWCSALGKIYSFPGEQRMSSEAVNTWQTMWESCSPAKASGRRVLWLRRRSDVQWNLFFVTFSACKVHAAVTESLITLEARWHIYVLVRRVPRSR